MIAASPSTARKFVTSRLLVLATMGLALTTACKQEPAPPAVAPAATQAEGSAAPATAEAETEATGDSAPEVVLDPALIEAANQGTLRLVSLAGGVTETLVALGLQDQIVGVDTSSQFPEAIRALPQVGYHRRLSAEGVLALNPTHIVMTNDAGPASALSQLRAAGVTLLDVGTANDIEAAIARTEHMGRMFGRTEQATAAVTHINETLAQITPPENPPRVLFVYARNTAVQMVASDNSPPDVLLKRAGLRNAAEGHSYYIPLTAEAVVAANPDLFMIPEQALASVGGLDGFGTLPGIAQTGDEAG